MDLSKKKKATTALNGRDLITIGIFSAIYFVFNFVWMLLGGLHPLIWILMPALVALTTGIPFLLMCSKVQKFGAVFIMGIITSCFYFVTGQFTVWILITFGSACILSEGIRYLSNYHRFSGNALAFVAFSLGMTGSPLPIWIMHDQFFAQISSQGMPQDYLQTLESYSSPWMLLVLFGAPIVGAVIGTMITKGMFKKHFQKAGIIS